MCERLLDLAGECMSAGQDPTQHCSCKKLPAADTVKVTAPAYHCIALHYIANGMPAAQASVLDCYSPMACRCTGSNEGELSSMMLAAIMQHCCFYFAQHGLLGYFASFCVGKDESGDAKYDARIPYAMASYVWMCVHARMKLGLPSSRYATATHV